MPSFDNLLFRKVFSRGRRPWISHPPDHYTIRVLTWHLVRWQFSEHAIRFILLPFFFNHLFHVILWRRTTKVNNMPCSWCASTSLSEGARAPSQPLSKVVNATLFLRIRGQHVGHDLSKHSELLVHGFRIDLTKGRASGGENALVFELGIWFGDGTDLPEGSRKGAKVGMTLLKRDGDVVGPRTDRNRVRQGWRGRWWTLTRVLKQWCW